MNKIFAFFLLGLTLAGCGNKQDKIEKTSNPKIDLIFLFEKDGCKMYRFCNGGRSVYWSDCRGKVEVTHTDIIGKVPVPYVVESETMTK